MPMHIVATPESSSDYISIHANINGKAVVLKFKDKVKVMKDDDILESLDFKREEIPAELKQLICEEKRSAKILINLAINR